MLSRTETETLFKTERPYGEKNNSYYMYTDDCSGVVMDAFIILKMQLSTDLY